MDLKETKEMLSIIAEAQQTCSDVELKIGTVRKSNIVVHGGVYIKDCPASVILKLQEAGYVLHMGNGYLSAMHK